MISAFAKDIHTFQKKKKTHKKKILTEIIKGFAKTFHMVLQTSCFITKVGYVVFSKYFYNKYSKIFTKIKN